MESGSVKDLSKYRFQKACANISIANTLYEADREETLDIIVKVQSFLKDVENYLHSCSVIK